MAYVYLHKTKDEGRPFYIGISSKEQKKGKYHRAEVSKNRNSHWNRIVKKHGFTWEILNDGLSWDEAQQYEKNYIKEYKEKGYQLANMTDGGEGTLGWKRTPKGRLILGDRIAKNKSLTVGGLMNKLKELDPDTPIYFGELNPDGIKNLLCMDEVSFIQRKQLTAYTEYDYNWGEKWLPSELDNNMVNCLVFIGASNFRYINDKMKIETEFKELDELTTYDDAMDTKENYDKLKELGDKLLIFRYLDNIIQKKY